MKSVPLFCALFFSSLQGIAQSPPPLSISLPSAAITRLSWPSSAVDWNLTANNALTGVWSPVTIVPQNEGNELAVLLPVSGNRRFFRLEKGCALMFITGAVNDESAGGASVNWSLTPIP